MSLKPFDRSYAFRLLKSKSDDADFVKTFSDDLLNDDLDSAQMKLETLLREKPIQSPLASQWKTVGFTTPIPDYPTMEVEDDVLGWMNAVPFVVAPEGADYLLFMFVKRERILPASTIKVEVDKRVAEWEERTGEPKSRKVYAQMKEEVVSKMLPTAPIRETRVPIITGSNYFVVFTSSPSMAEEVTKEIRNLTSSFPVMPVASAQGCIGKFLYDLAIEDERVAGTFTLGNYAKIKDMDDGEYHFKNVDLQNDVSFQGILDSLSGQMSYLVGRGVTEARIEYEDSTGQDVEFVLNTKGVLKSMLTDLLFDDIDEREDYSRESQRMEMLAFHVHRFLWDILSALDGVGAFEEPKLEGELIHDEDEGEL